MSSALSTADDEVHGRPCSPSSMLERVTLIMEVFDGPDAHRSLEGVVAATRLPRSTTHRILDQLVRLQWLRHTAFGYALGRRTLNLSGARDIEHGALRSAAAPFLRELARRTGLTVGLGIVATRYAYVVDLVEGGEIGEFPGHVGSKLPAHCTALGKAVLAGLPPEEVDAACTGALDRLTTTSIGDVAELHHELSRIRNRSGVAFEHEECFTDVRAAAAAVSGPVRPVGAIAVLGNARAPVERMVPLLLRTARAVAADFAAKMQTAQAALLTQPTPLPLPIRASEEAMGRTTTALVRGRRRL